jgi:hypothetical protein
MLDYQPGKVYLLTTCTNTEAQYVRVTDASKALLLYRDRSNQNKILLLGYKEEIFKEYCDDDGSDLCVRFTFTFLIVGFADVQKVVYTLYEETKEKIKNIVKEI